jgi:hypothetical protein
LTTLRSLRATAAQGYRLRWSVPSASVPTGGTLNTTTSLFDPSRTESEGAWDRVESWVLFTSGTNNNQVRQISGFSALGVNALQWTNPLAASVASGDSYQLFLSARPNDWDLAINSALRDMSPERLITAVATAAEPDGTLGTHWMAVPSVVNNTISNFIKVERSVGTLVSDFNYQTLIQDVDYTLVPVTTGSGSDGTLRLEFRYQPTLNTLLRFWYERRVTELSADTDDTAEPAAVILTGARKWMALQEGDEAAYQRWTKEHELAKRDYLAPADVVPLRKPVINVFPGPFNRGMGT